MNLLQANVLSIATFKDGKDDKTKSNQIDINSEVNIISDNALLPQTSSLGVSPSILDYFSDEVSVYVVRKGDSISQIADMFGVSVNTILVANDMKKGRKLVQGEVLFILPISAVEHKVA